MEISGSFNRYDSAIQPNNELQQTNKTTRANNNSIRTLLEAYKVDLSPRALNSSELNDPSINFPTHNPEVLQYSENLNLIFKP